MANWINKLVQKAHRFNWVDYLFFKLTLVSAGVLLGVYFPLFFRSWIMGVWVIFAISWLWIMFKVFFCNKSEDK